MGTAFNVRGPHHLFLSTYMYCAHQRSSPARSLNPAKTYLSKALGEVYLGIPPRGSSGRSVGIRPGRCAATVPAPCPGQTTKPIEAVEVGDFIWAWDEAASNLVKRRVNRLFRNQDKRVLQVVCASSSGMQQVIEATTEHPFWIEGKGWVDACKLQADDILKRVDGGFELRVCDVIEATQRADVYNFEVEEVHNYFVGKYGVLVHNASYRPSDLKALDARSATDISARLTGTVKQHISFTRGGKASVADLPLVLDAGSQLRSFPSNSGADREAYRIIGTNGRYREDVIWIGTKQKVGLTPEVEREMAKDYNSALSWAAEKDLPYVGSYGYRGAHFSDSGHARVGLLIDWVPDSVNSGIITDRQISSMTSFARRQAALELGEFGKGLKHNNSGIMDWQVQVALPSGAIWGIDLEPHAINWPKGLDSTLNRIEALRLRFDPAAPQLFSSRK